MRTSCKFTNTAKIEKLILKIGEHLASNAFLSRHHPARVKNQNILLTDNDS